MGKRLLEHSESVIMSTDKVPKKNERSHEENQERAYIAASRRSDRSIEARLQSARMASEIHKKRTGKGFKITEEIVRKEEMYEEEDDDLPRHYRALAAHLRTTSSSLNHRTNAYVTSQIAAAAFAREAEINRQFAEQFPNAPVVSRQLAREMYAQPLPQEPSPVPHSYQPGHHFGSPQPMGYHAHHRSQSVAQITTQPQMGFAQFDHQSPMVRHGSFDEALPALTPSSGRTETPSSTGTPPLFQTDDFRPKGQSTPALPVDPSLGTSDTDLPFSFTSEIASNVKDLTSIDPVDSLTPFYMGFVGGELAGSDAAMWPTDFLPPRDVPIPSSEYKPIQATSVEPSNSVDASHMMLEDAFPIQQGSRIGTPDLNASNDSWKFWIADYNEGEQPEIS